MAEYISSAMLHIPGVGHVLMADPGTEMFNLDAFKFGDDTTHSGWTWLGDTAQDNPVGFEDDGGDSDILGTWDRPSARSKNEAVKLSGTINMAAVKKETVLAAFPGTEWDEGTKSFKMKTNGSSERALVVVTEDGDDIAALAFARVSLKGGLPNFEREDFQNWEIKFNVLDSTKPSIPTIQWFTPRPYKAAGVGG